jgi:hypothetical protein
MKGFKQLIQMANIGLAQIIELELTISEIKRIPLQSFRYSTYALSRHKFSEDLMPNKDLIFHLRQTIKTDKVAIKALKNALGLIAN